MCGFRLFRGKMSEITDLFKKLARHQAENCFTYPSKHQIEGCFNEIKDQYYNATKENQIKAQEEWKEIGLL